MNLWHWEKLRLSCSKFVLLSLLLLRLMKWLCPVKSNTFVPSRCWPCLCGQMACQHYHLPTPPCLAARECGKCRFSFRGGILWQIRLHYCCVS